MANLAPCRRDAEQEDAENGKARHQFDDVTDDEQLDHSLANGDRLPRLAQADVLDRHGADHDRWRFLTGDRKQIYDLARRSYFAAMDEGDGGPDDFVHTENFVLVDSQRRIRGFYDGTSEKDVDRLIGDLRKLLKEEKA